MKILSIETSCDETAVAVIETKRSSNSHDLVTILSNVVLSQIEIHKEYGGVFPSLAKREHSKNVLPVFIEAMEKAGLLDHTDPQDLAITQDEVQTILHREPELLAQFLEVIPGLKKPDIDAIAVTYGPGLEPALWVGVNFSKALALAWGIPLIPVNHMEGHIISALFPSTEEKTPFQLHKIKYPALALLISGGHTELVLSRKPSSYEVVGETRDDAAGEAFDKVARILDLPYPGGPEISRIATRAKNKTVVTLPRPMLGSHDFDFSFSGLKTAVLYLVKERGKISDDTRADIAKEFEEAVTEVLVSKTLRALDEYGAQTLIIGGGVSANDTIRRTFTEKMRQEFPECDLHIPKGALATDNALMIALAGYSRYTTTNGKDVLRDIQSILDLNADGGLSFSKAS